MHPCDVRGCDNSKGFTSSNDLDRHKKSVHNIALPHGRDKSFQCQAANCRKSDKIWPRLDNFKNHCKNCHREEDLEELVRKSEMKPEDRGSEHNLLAETDQAVGQSSLDISTNTTDDLSFFNPMQQSNESLSIPPAASSNISEPLSSNEFATSSSNPVFSPLFVDQRPDLLSVQSEPIRSQIGQHLDGFLMEPSFHNAQISADDNAVATNIPIMGRLSPRTRPLSNVILESFSYNLLDDISKVLTLKESMRRQIHAVIDERVNQLALDISSTNDFSVGSPDTNSTTLTQFGTSGRLGVKFSCKHLGCGKSYYRQSQLKKHSKRHSRPYFCTWSDCMSGRTFGSKADWKRHENILHFRHQTYHCQELSLHVPGEECGKPFQRAEPYATHLRKDHGIGTEDYIQQKLGEKDTESPPPDFWCGYCRETIPIPTDSDEPRNERFDHIEKHFLENMTIDRWLPPHDTHDNTLMELKNLSSKRVNDPGRQSINLDLDYGGMIFGHELYNGQGEDLDDYPRPKRARAQAPDEQDWSTMPISEEDQHHPPSQNNNHWLSNTM